MLEYSKIVIILKFFLPVLAIAILAVLFVSSPQEEFGDPVKVSTFGMIQDMTYQIEGAKLRGVTEEGYRFDFKAESIDPDVNNKEILSFNNMSGTILIFDDTFYVTTKSANINTNDKYVELSGNLEITTESGISVITEKLRMDLESQNIFSSGIIKLTTPFGLIEGGSMMISGSEKDTLKSTYILLEKGVKMSFNTQNNRVIE